MPNNSQYNRLNNLRLNAGTKYFQSIKYIAHEVKEKKAPSAANEQQLTSDTHFDWSQQINQFVG